MRDDVASAMQDDRGSQRGRPAGVVILGRSLRREREARGVTRNELALAVGVNPRTIQRAENGQPVSHRVIRCVCDFLGLPASRLEQGELAS